MKALVTGASGIVGANLVRELLTRGYDVRVLTRGTQCPRALLTLPVAMTSGDVRDVASLETAMAGVDVVFHAAARFAYWGVSTTEMEAVAVGGTRNVVETAAKALVERVVVTSSSVVFGSSPIALARDETANFTREDASAYALVKLRQTRVAQRTAKLHGVDLVCACPTLTIGGHDFGLSTSNAIITKYLNDPFKATFPGGCNLVSARDIARGHILLLERGEAGSAYILGADNLRWRDVHSHISRIAGTPGPLSTANYTTAYLTAAWCEANARMTGVAPALTRAEAKMVGRYYWYNDSKARALGYAPASSLSAMQEAISWLIRTEHINPAVRATLNVRGFSPSMSTT